MSAWRDHLATLDADQRKDWEERSAIREYDGHLPAPGAEFAAYKDYCRRMGLKTREQDELFVHGPGARRVI